MRYSKQREAILKVIQTTKNHPTADWIYSKVRKRIPNISLGTVYRNLKQLVDRRVIRTNIIDGVAHFDKNLINHHHFFCIQCQSLYDLDLNLERSLSDIETETKHLFQGYDLQVRGICKMCQVKKM